MDYFQSLRVFVKIADLGGFTRAASALDISNSVVTRALAELEAHLGTRLLNRTTRSLSLTEAGRVYLEKARQILVELDDAKEMVAAGNREPSGTLRIVAPVVFGLNSLAPLLQSYSARFPKIVTDLTLLDHQVDLVAEGFDVGIMVFKQMRSSSIVTRHLTTENWIVCAAPSYLEKHGVPSRVEQISHHVCLSLPADHWGVDCTFTRSGGAACSQPLNRFVANNIEMLRRLAILGMGVATLPDYLIKGDITCGRLVHLFSDRRHPKFDIHVAYPSRRYLAAKVRTFVDHIVSNFDHVASAEQSCSP
ncbi:LysR family transcriptional regulator [Burkholderia pseudomallei]|uniref:LysR family transcriptional regulator n=1 Tax=Burkholderia pseudomallei TaxID=28450 RepID=UPI00016B1F49|nr:bacterial regulatory helix-turn-helix, lysR family protein [Burkholderia pseudomallei MSHR305]AGZ31708.1 bacterial regulatory helix-turn-helix, lysR family protein [Burkholderia pseudomallei NCTC 13179]AHK68544.1 bacterial regulatory helix-turn-helix, lysR family protein [Burkholderia pseudomallei MSHR520]AIP83412.1 bacterial regulatory helix-turn-helix, lysR family protein [Burkholderia pseudomallei]KGS08864.1 bacterial regulatory helix-turn-helix, lysR family protein [Burkholderia pseudoma